MKLAKILLVAVSVLLASTVQAHYLWLEQSSNQTKLYFGEYENTLHEKTGGRLDLIADPHAITNPLVAKGSALSIKRMEDYLSVETAKLEPVIAYDISMKVKDLTKYNIGIVKPIYYARTSNGTAEGLSALDLDIQPLGNNKVRINLHGKPLAKAKLKVYAPNQWLQELDANEAGEITFNTPWNGLYVLEAVYVEPVKGVYQNDAYDGIRNVSTLSVTVSGTH